MKILFITRKFPPSTGGMENVAFELYEHLKPDHKVFLLKWGGGQIFLPVIFSYFLLRATALVWFRRPEVVYLQDGVLAPMGWWLKTVTNAPVCITVHGLDITYQNAFFQWLIPKSIKKLDKVITVSSATKKEVVKRDIEESKVSVIPNGIKDEFYVDKPKAQIRRQLAQKTDLDLHNKKVLLTVGRLVERKGVHWFVGNVMGGLNKKYTQVLYLVAGSGPYSETIQEAIDKNDLNESVKLLGRVSDEVLKLLYNATDVFVMPNIKVEGDMEGFGIVLLEAASAGQLVVASGIEGINDAITDDKNGILVASKDSHAYISTLSSFIDSQEKLTKFGKKSREFTLKHNSWESITKAYVDIFKDVLS